MRAGGGGCLLSNRACLGRSYRPVPRVAVGVAITVSIGALWAACRAPPGGAHRGVATPNYALTSPPHPRTFYVPHGALTNRRKTGPGPGPGRDKNRCPAGAIWCTFGASKCGWPGNGREGQKPLPWPPGKGRFRPAERLGFPAGSGHHRHDYPARIAYPSPARQCRLTAGRCRAETGTGSVHARRTSDDQPTPMISDAQ